MDIEAIEYGIEKYGTPLYIFDTDIIMKTVNKFRRILNEDLGLCFAIKANPFLTNLMAESVDRIEVCSMGEFRICRDLKIKPEKILISGVLKKKEDLKQILDVYRGGCTYTVESINQFLYMANWSEANKEVLHLYLRLSSGNQFGMDEKTLQYTFKTKKMYPYLEIQGIHYFSGTQKKTIEKVLREVEYIDNFCCEFEKKMHVKLMELEYGPGINVSYFEGQQINTEIDMKMISEAISQMQWKGKIILEMGRPFAADCGYYATTVRDIKQTNEKNYCIVDGGMHQLNYDGQIRGMYTPIFRVLPEPSAGKVLNWTVCGSLCTANDILIQRAAIKNLQEGNVLVFENVGAYSVSEGMALFLSHELPSVVFYSKNMGWKIARNKKETYTLNMEEQE